MTTPQPQHAIDAAKEIMALNYPPGDAIENVAAIIAAHPDPELAMLGHENSALITQADRLRAEVKQLKASNEFANFHRQVQESIKLRARVSELESQLNDAREHGARMQRERDECKWQAKTWEEVAGQHCADAAKLEQQLHAMRLVCGTTDANKFEAALDRANAKIKELEARKEASQ